MSMEQDKQHAFDAYCKRLVKNEAVNIQLEYARQAEREVSFSDLTSQEVKSLLCVDHYDLEQQTFPILNVTVEIEDENLGRALEALSPERRVIVLSAYALGMSGIEIARQFRLRRSTVQYRRTNALKELRKLLEGYQYE